MNANHPDWKQILDALEDAGANGAAREHLDACARCGEVAARLRELLDGLAVVRGTRPPEALVEKAIRVVMNEADPWSAVREIFRRGLALVQATLVTAPAPVRGGAPPMLLYEAPSYSVTVSITADPAGQARRVQVRGQLMPRTASELPADSRAILVGAGGHAESALSPFGEFSFREFPRDRLHLAIEAGAERLEIGPFGESD